MALILTFLLLALVLGAIGFAIHLLWLFAGLALVVWLVGLLVRAPKRSSPRR